MYLYHKHEVLTRFVMGPDRKFNDRCFATTVPTTVKLQLNLCLFHFQHHVSSLLLCFHFFYVLFFKDACLIP